MAGWLARVGKGRARVGTEWEWKRQWVALGAYAHWRRHRDECVAAAVMMTTARNEESIRVLCWPPVTTGVRWRLAEPQPAALVGWGGRR